MSNWDMWKNIDNKSYVLYVEELYLHPWFIHLISALKPPCFFLKSVEFPGDPWMCSEEIVKQKQTIFQIGTILGLETWCAYDIWHFFLRYLWTMNLVLTIHRRCMMWQDIEDLKPDLCRSQPSNEACLWTMEILHYTSVFVVIYVIWQWCCTWREEVR